MFLEEDVMVVEATTLIRCIIYVTSGIAIVLTPFRL